MGVQELFDEERVASQEVEGGQQFDVQSAAYPTHGSKRRLYRVYVPNACLKKPVRRFPLVLVLHGCQQTHRDIQHVSAFNKIAQQQGFIVAYPFVTRYHDLRLTNCWGWWRPDQIRPGRGEVQDLKHIVDEICKAFPIHRRRIHIAGLSSGAAMSVAAMVAHPNTFASGAAVAGVAYGERIGAVVARHSALRSADETVGLIKRVQGETPRLAPLCIVHSHNDEVVPIGAGKSLRDAWLHYHDLQSPAEKVTRHETGGVPWVHTRYGKLFRKSQVETVFLEGPGHGWCGGPKGRFSYPDAPDITQLIWKFFKRHR